MHLIFVTILVVGCGSFSFDNNIAFWNHRTRNRNGTQLRSSHHVGRPLFMSTFQETKQGERKSKNPFNVVYQKVVRPSSHLPEILFLGYLVEYLQEVFSLPSNLPMVYERHLPPDDDHDNAIDVKTDGDRSILWWDSHLTPNSDSTRLHVEVVGIYSQDATTSASAVSTAPDMAMVVVRKKRQSGQSFPLMMKNLFEDSEKRIFRALDVGLEDFVAGRVPINRQKEESDKAVAAKIPNIRTVDEAIQAELMEEHQVLGGSTERNEEQVIIDTIATKDVSQPTTPTQRQPSNLPASVEDYAIRAAKKPAVLRAMQKPPKPTAAPEKSPMEDYAVEAARQQSQKKLSTLAAPLNNGAKVEQDVQSALPTGASPSPPQDSKHDFQTSRSKKRQTRRSRVGNQKSPGASSPSSESTSEQANGSVNDKDKNTKRRLNIIYHDAKTSDPTTDEELVTFAKESTQPDSEPRIVQPKGKIPTQQQLELDIAEAARQALSEIADQGVDMSAEEMLADVLKYGEQKDKENSAGNGFVSGALEKAKELLRERNRQREEKLVARVKEVEKQMNPFKVDIQDLDHSKSKPSPEEELRQMFEAGERLADGRISFATTVSDSNLAEPRAKTSAQVVEELIADETTVSQRARVLDDELAELEVRINKSPGEELDGPKRNAIFDIFSGPEVYNPNVDPETAVNWPGALPGTKEVRLPRELDEAVKQAKFAVDVLSKLSEITDHDGETRFRLGDKELSQEQVERLQTVANEAVQIGLISNPLDLMAERSRLDIVVKEMWDQPEERFREIASNYKDLLLSDNLVDLVKERLANMAQRDLDAFRRNDDSLEVVHERERNILGHLVNYAQVLLKEARALGAELEAQQLEVIRSICRVAMDPTHVTEEETAMALTDAVRDMRPLFDDAFVAYLKYAVAEEEGRLARAGLLDDPDHSQWLFVLKIVQQGVYTEISRGINRYIEHIWYVLRMKTKTERRMLLEKLIDVMPSMDVRPFVQVVENIVGALGESARGEFDGFTVLGEMTNKLLQLHRDVKELLPPDRIDRMSRDADEWVAKQKQRLLEHRKLTKQRLKAARETEHLDGEIEAFGRRGEVERMT